MIKKNAKKPIPQNFESQIVSTLRQSPYNNSRSLNFMLELLYKSCYRLLKAIGSEYKIEPEVMEDIFQDTLCILIKKVRNNTFIFQSRDSFYGWCKITMKNLASNYIRKQSLFENENINRLQSAQMEPQNVQMITPSCSLQQKALEIIENKLSPQAAKVLATGVVYNLPNELSAKIMNYKDESVYRKKKSQHLAELRSKISKSDEACLRGLAS